MSGTGTARRMALGWGAALILAQPTVAHGQVAMSLMVGHWRGDAEVVAEWTRQRSLPVNIVIFANDMVTGTVGDAALTDGELRANRSWIASVMRRRTGYVIQAKLTGPVSRPDGIERAVLSMPLQWIDGRFEGGMTLSGWVAGGADKAPLGAGRLILHRVPDVTICQVPPAWYEP